MNKKNAKSSWIFRTSVGLGILTLAIWQGGGKHGRSLLAVQNPGVGFFFSIPAPVPPITLAPESRVLEQRETVRASHAAPDDQWIVRVHVLAGKPLKFISIDSDEALRISSLPGQAAHRIEGKIAVSVDGPYVLIRQHGRVIVSAPSVVMRTESPMRIRQTDGHLLRTPGELRISVRAGHLHLVNVLPLESYLMGIVEPELGSLNLPKAAMEAQLVASRSYILAVRDRHPHEDFDFCDSPHCQVYAGMTHFPPRFMKAALAVRGIYLRYHGAPAAAFFHHSCGGSTEAIEDAWGGRPVPYLRRVKDNDEGEFLGSHGAVWIFTLSRKSFTKLARARHWIQGRQALDEIRVIRADRSGRATEILIQSDQPKWVSARTFLQTMNRAYDREVLPSLLFHITLSGDVVRFDGRGWGHGVGMCQSGAVAMARQGKTWQEILQHYYPGTTIAHAR